MSYLCRTVIYCAIFSVIASMAACGKKDDDTPQPTQTVQFSRDIQPIFDSHCIACHFPGGRAGFTGLSLRPADS